MRTVRSDGLACCDSLKMTATRREFLVTTSARAILAMAASLGLIKPSALLAADEDRGAFSAKTVENTLRALGANAVAEGKEIGINAPDIAENGAVVQVEVTSGYPNTRAISILADKNPNTLASRFELAEGTEAYLHTRIKMNETSNLVVVVKAGDRFYLAKKEIKITMGGCG